MKRIISMILLITMLLTAVACGKSDTNGADTTTTAAATEAPIAGDTSTSVEETTLPPETGFAESIPEEEIAALGLDGYTVNVFMRAEGVTWDNQDIWVECATGDVFNDAVFNRNLYLEENTASNSSCTARLTPMPKS